MWKSVPQSFIMLKKHCIGTEVLQSSPSYENFHAQTVWTECCFSHCQLWLTYWAFGTLCRSQWLQFNVILIRVLYTVRKILYSSREKTPSLRQSSTATSWGWGVEDKIKITQVSQRWIIIGDYASEFQERDHTSKHVPSSSYLGFPSSAS